MQVEKFPCSGCGACCSMVGKELYDYKAYVDSLNLPRKEKREMARKLSFPYKQDEGGKCEKLNEDNTCGVYNNRPLVCSVSKMATVLGYKKLPYFEYVKSVCNSLMKRNNIDESFLLK